MKKDSDVLRMDENWTSTEVLEKRFPDHPSYAVLERARHIMLAFIRELSDIPANGYRGDYKDLKHDLYRASRKLIEIVDLHADAYEWELGFNYRIRQMSRNLVRALASRLDQ